LQEKGAPIIWNQRENQPQKLYTDGDSLPGNGTLDDAELGLLFEAELAAGGGDVVALFTSEGGYDAGFDEDILEGVLVDSLGRFHSSPSTVL
jgi:hypothetical protein